MQYMVAVALESGNMDLKKEKNKNVLLSFEEELLLDARKVMFKNNMTLQQFFTFILHRLVLEDPTATDLLNKAVKFQEEKLSKENKEEIKKVNINALYSLFEEREKAR